MRYSIGEKPGVGTYVCNRCKKWEVNLDNNSDRLPPCGNCGPGQKITYSKSY